MLKVKDIRLSTVKYGDAYECVVTFQVGDASYNTVPVTLPPEVTRGLAELAVKKAADALTIVPTDFRVDGEPLPLIPAAPEFPEVEEAPEPTPEEEQAWHDGERPSAELPDDLPPDLKPEEAL